ncbi:MAG TPA: threonylcarbamoyl-AMP synthase [Candidatus Moranbacteria bacterium]|nr:MAG: Sua5/YciO/YrdC/YwlC family protein [Candidatus Moranbacteria bacterium GW2011_GWC2_45_10]HAV11651.1 threonylcarbamoyl-AMP synthase [Candidatus Moranbacteria bacterium]
MDFFKLRQLKKEIVPVIREGGIGVLPTDTLYGIVGSALRRETVERIYKLRKRNLKKPMIILISSWENLRIFDIKISRKQKKFLKEVWPGKVSVVLDCDCDNFDYLHRGTRSLAFRVPDEKWLRKFLEKTGPLVAPSANFEGEKPATTKQEAKGYFGENVDFYVDLEKLESAPSMIIKLEDDGNFSVLREGGFSAEK